MNMSPFFNVFGSTTKDDVHFEAYEEHIERLKKEIAQRDMEIRNLEKFKPFRAKNGQFMKVPKIE